jgi:hypothetical protein
VGRLRSVHPNTLHSIIPKSRLEVLSAAKNALNQYGVGGHDERYGGAPFKSDNA